MMILIRQLFATAANVLTLIMEIQDRKGTIYFGLLQFLNYVSLRALPSRLLGHKILVLEIN